MHNNIKYRHPTLLQDARMKQGTKGDGTKAYELLLKVPRTPTFGISPEKKLVDRFLEMVKYCSSLRFTFTWEFCFPTRERDEYTENLQKAKVCEASNGCRNCAPQQVARQVPAVSFQHIIISTEYCKTEAVDERWSLRSIQDCEVHKLANLWRDTSVQIVSSQVTEHSQQEIGSIIWQPNKLAEQIDETKLLVRSSS